MKKKELKYDGFWYNYCLDIDPKRIEQVIQERYIKSNGKKIHLDILDDAPDEAKPTILFIHGTAVYSRFYAEFLHDLSRNKYRVVALDLPGHGKSEGRRGHFSIEELVSTIKDVTSFIIENYGKKVVVIGSSLGGITTLYTAAADPRISACVCVNAALLNEKGHKRILNLKGIFKAAKIFVPFLSKILPRLKFSVWIYLDPKTLVKQERSLKLLDTFFDDPLISSKYSLKALATQMKAAPERPVESIKTPIMILNGSDDVLFSIEYMKEIYDRLTNSENKRLEIIKDGSHCILNEHREESLKKVMDWLATLNL